MTALSRQASNHVQLLRFTTCGSVDDGKSTLIGRLLHDSKSILEDQYDALKQASLMRGESEINLANLTDGLRAEREQGITIDVAYRYFATAHRRFIVADSPGHVQYTRNMVTGASTSSLALILVDARQGVIEQTRRHSIIASLLGIPHLVLCVNKMDLVKFSQTVFENIRQDFIRFSTRLKIKDVTIIPMSALHGDGVVNPSPNLSWYLGEPLLPFLESVHIARDLNMDDPRFPVQWVIHTQSTRSSHFRAFAGQIASGVFKVGDAVLVLPSGRHSTIKAIQLMDRCLPLAYAPMSVSLMLDDEIDISRGDMIVSADNLPYMSKEIQAMVCWMDTTPLRVGKTYLIKHTTHSTKAMVCHLQHRININNLAEEETPVLRLNEIGRVTLRAATPLLYDRYQRNRNLGGFILIDESTYATVGAVLCEEPTKIAPSPEYTDYSI